MLDIDHLAQFLAAATAVIIVPGPATLFVAARAQRSVAGAVGAALGIATGDILLMILSGAGFAALIAQWPTLLSILSLVGALYLGYLGAGLLRSRPEAASAPPGTSAGGFLKGILITLTNPKPIVFFATFFPAFIPPDTDARVQAFATLGALFELIGVLYFAVLILVVSRVGRGAVDDRRSSVVRRISGAGLLGCSAMLLITALGR